MPGHGSELQSRVTSCGGSHLRAHVPPNHRAGGRTGPRAHLSAVVLPAALQLDERARRPVHHGEAEVHVLHRLLLSQGPLLEHKAKSEAGVPARPAGPSTCWEAEASPRLGSAVFGLQLGEHCSGTRWPQLTALARVPVDTAAHSGLGLTSARPGSRPHAAHRVGLETAGRPPEGGNGRFRPHDGGHPEPPQLAESLDTDNGLCIACAQD